MEIGYVSMTDIRYEKLSRILVESLLEYSKYKIIMYSINFDLSYDSPNLIKKRIDINPLTYNNICFSKFRICYESGLDVGLVLDSDMIANKTVDDVLENNMKKSLNYEFPLCSKHPDVPFDNWCISDNLLNFKDFFGINKLKDEYINAQYIFSNKSKWFLEECYKFSQNMIKIGLDRNIYCADEGLLNIMLAKYNVEDDLGMTYYMHPNAVKEYISDNIDLETKRLKNSNNKSTIFGSNKYKINYNLFHGCKDFNEAKNLFLLLKNYNEKYNIEKYDIGHWTGTGLINFSD